MVTSMQALQSYNVTTVTKADKVQGQQKKTKKQKTDTMLLTKHCVTIT